MRYLIRGGLKTLLIAIAIVMVSCENPTDNNTNAGNGGNPEAENPGPFVHGEGVHRGSPAIAGWATAVATNAGGYQKGEGAEIYNDPAGALGPFSGSASDVLVLGEGGQVTLTFAAPIVNSEQYADFVVYENGLLDPVTGKVFAELARVAVASQDDSFVFFPVRTTRNTPVEPFEAIDPADYRGFAGIHPLGTGTAFNLQELAEKDLVISGAVNLSEIRFVRIVDIIGDGRETDADGKKIYDPFPTFNIEFSPKNTSGFDLGGIAVLRDP